MRIALILLLLSHLSAKAQVLTPPSIALPQFVAPEISTDNVVMFITCPAKFIGGADSLKSYIHSKLDDVTMNWADSIPEKRGKVTFIVEKDGSLTDIQIYQSVSSEIDAAMIAMVEEMPIWQPACDQNGSCRERILLPVNFSLPD